MKHLVCGLTFAAIALAQNPRVSECFKVHELLRADAEHYWATWTNTCPYTIDAVYVTVRFADRTSKNLADGVWSLHFVPSGAHRTMRFSAPGKLGDFASVHQKKITADMTEAFGKPALSSIEMAAVSAYRGAVAKETDLRPRVVVPVSTTTIIGDPGEASFRTDFPDAWQAVLSPQESAVSVAPRGSFVRFVSEDKPIFR